MPGMNEDCYSREQSTGSVSVWCSFPTHHFGETSMCRYELFFKTEAFVPFLITSFLTVGYFYISS